MFQNKRYYFSVLRDKELVNLVWHLMLLNGNSLQENGIIILLFWLCHLLDELSNKQASFFLVGSCLSAAVRNRSGFYSLCSRHKNVTDFLPLRSSYKLFIENQGFTRAGAVKTKINITFNFGKRDRFSFCLRSIVRVMKKIPFFIFYICV